MTESSRTRCTIALLVGLITPLHAYADSSFQWKAVDTGGTASPQRDSADIFVLEHRNAMYGGEAFDFIAEPPFLVAIPLDDVWVYDIGADRWTLLDGRKAPAVVREFQAFSITKERWKQLEGPAQDLPPTKRSVIAKIGDTLYLFGVMDGTAQTVSTPRER